MNLVIKNFRNLHVSGRLSTRLIGLDDNPPTCTMTYSEINPGPDQHPSHPLMGA